MLLSPHHLARLRLIALTDAALQPWAQVEAAALLALSAGLPALMLREKTLSDEELLPIARRLREATTKAGALLILNRRLELARQIRPDAIHLGASGPTIEAVRAEFGSAVLIGYSAHAHDEALAAFARGADYVFYSPLFDTPSKRGILPPLGLKKLAALTREAPGPVIALGGLNEERVAPARQAGAHGIALLRGILAQPDPAETTRRYLALLPLSASA